MVYLITFIEGIITFISPCLLPMLPIYIVYFAGNEDDRHKVWVNALAFILGFTIVFTAMGAFAGSIGSFITRYQTVLNIISGAIVIIFGLNFIGVLNINILNRTRKVELEHRTFGFGPTLLFGMVFALGWTPCVGAFLGSALLLASQHGSVLKGLLLLLTYSLGLGIPFFISAVLIDRLRDAFTFIKNNYRIINLISGALLIIIGLLMMTGLLESLLTVLS